MDSKIVQMDSRRSLKFPALLRARRRRADQTRLASTAQPQGDLLIHPSVDLRRRLELTLLTKRQVQEVKAEILRRMTSRNNQNSSDRS